MKGCKFFDWETPILVGKSANALKDIAAHCFTKNHTTLMRFKGVIDEEVDEPANAYRIFKAF